MDFSVLWGSSFVGMTTGVGRTINVGRTAGVGMTTGIIKIAKVKILIKNSTIHPNSHSVGLVEHSVGLFG